MMCEGSSSRRHDRIGAELRFCSDLRSLVGSPVVSFSDLCTLRKACARSCRITEGPAISFATSYESPIREAGFDVFVIPNQGQGAASARIEKARRLLRRVFFNAETTEGGRDALGWYH